MTAEGGEAEEAEREGVEALGFEVAMRELEEIVRRLESGEVELEESIAMYERGALLKQQARTHRQAFGNLDLIFSVRPVANGRKAVAPRRDRALRRVMQ